MKSVEIIAKKETLDGGFSDLLSDAFGTVSERDAARFWRSEDGVMSEHAVVIYELAFPRVSLDPISEFVERLDPNIASSLQIKVNGEPFYEGAALTRDIASSASISPTWPSRFDIAVQTVIGRELEAAQDVFKVDPIKDAVSLGGTIFYRGSVPQGGTVLSVVICAQNAAGNSNASIFAERLVQRWNPKVIFLMGICAGRRTKCRIGDVVTPRVIVNDTEGVIEAEERLGRPKIYAPPHAMIQQLQNFRYESSRTEWMSELHNTGKLPVKGEMTQQEFGKIVNSRPDRHESAIYSADLLLRDAAYLEQKAESVHQQIRIGEMEAAGFSEACNARSTPTPWFVVRGVSDYGDETKGDGYQTWAAYSAATYLRTLIRNGINFSLFE